MNIPYRFEEPDVRFLHAFLDGMRAARMALTKHRWEHGNKLISVDEAIKVIDQEREQSVRILAEQIMEWGHEV